MENTFGMDIIPQNEAERLENLKKYKILYTRTEPIFDQLAAVAATVLKVPVAMINFVDQDKVWTKANQEGENGQEVPRGTSLCSLAILNDEVTVFENALEEPCLIANPLVAGNFGLRFYAAAPIRSPEGFNLGAICVVDKKARKFTEKEQQKLEWVAAMIEKEVGKRAG